MSAGSDVPGANPDAAPTPWAGIAAMGTKPSGAKGITRDPAGITNVTLPPDDLVALLVARLVPIAAVAQNPSPAIERVIFQGDRFDFCELGDKAFVFTEGDDQIAWDPVGDRLASRFGIAWALGQGDLGLDGMGTTGRALPVRKNPWDWLRCVRLGIVIFDWDLAARALAGMTVEADEPFAHELRHRLRPPPPRILVRRGRRWVAA